MQNKRELKGILILLAFVLVFAGSCNYTWADTDIESPTEPLNLQLTLDDDQIDLGQNEDENTTGKYKKYNKWVNSLRDKLKGYNSKPKIKLYWEASSDNINVAGYKVFRNGIEIGTSESTVFIDDNFIETESYDYYVVAFDGAMNLSKPSNTSSYGKDTIPPSAPQLTANAVSDTTVRLSWTQSSDDKGVKEYIVFRNGSEIKKLSLLNYDDTLLSPGTSYEYSIKAVDFSGNTSEFSNQASASTYSQDKIDSGLLFIKQNSSVILNWSKINGFSNYNLYRKTDIDGTFSRIAQPSSNTYTDNSLTAGTAYYYEIGYANDFGFEIISSPVYMYYSTGTNVSGNIGNNVWTSTGSPYIIKSSITIASGSTLKIMPGTVIELDQGAVVYVDGKLESLGTPQYPVVFTSDADGGNGVQNYNSWGSIVVGYNGNFTGDYTKIKYGGNTSSIYNGMIYVQGKFNLTNSEVSGYFKSGIYLDTRSPVSIKNNTISSSTLYEAIAILDGNSTYQIENNNIINVSKSYGIYIKRYSGSPNRLSIKNNTINTGRYPVAVMLDEVYGQLSDVISGITGNTFAAPNNSIGLTGKLSYSLTIPKGVFSIDSPARVNYGSVLTLSPGTVLRLTGNDSLFVEGKILAMGTAQDPIVFTSESDAAYGGTAASAGGGFGIRISTTGELTGDYIKVRFGGYYYSDINTSSAIYTQGTIRLTNSEISRSNGTGIYYLGGIAVLVSNTFKDNDKYAVYGGGGLVVDAAYNNWGGTDGPGLTTNAVYNAIYTPWLGGQYDTQLHFGDNEVSTISGNFSRNYTDMTMEVPGFDLNIGRTYNSRDSRTKSVLGRGWYFSLEGNIKDFGDSGAKIVMLPDGSVQTFNYDGYGSYYANDSRNKLLKQDDGTFILTTKDQYKYGFNSKGYLIWMKDRNDNTVTIGVDYYGKVTYVMDAAGRMTNVFYNPQGMISTITDPIGRTVKYEYTNNRLTKVTDPAGKVTNYNYDDYGYLSEIKDGSQNLIDSVVYNHLTGESQDKIIKTSDAFGNTLTYSYDNQNRKITIEDSNGRQIITWYDILGYPIKIQDPEAKITSTEYFTEWNGINKFGEEKSVTDRNGNVTKYIRDYRGNIIKIINPDGSFKEFTFDDKNNKASEKDENGKFTFYIYDANKINLIKKAQPLNGTDRYSISADQTKFAVTQYNYYTDAERQQLGYSEKGLLKNEIDSEGGIMSYTYDSSGNVKTITDPENKTITNSYNKIGWEISTISPKGYITNYSYDNDGRPEKTVLNNGETIRIVYNIEGRKIKEISPNIYNPALDEASSHNYSGDIGYRYAYYPSGRVKNITDPENNITSYTYDLYGNVIAETNPNGSVYQYEYDVMNRLSKAWFKKNASMSAVLLESYTYTTLPDGKTQKTETKYLNYTQTAITIYTYDYAMRLIEQKNPDGSVQKTSYNLNGTTASTTDANGNITYYAYDGLNRQTAKWVPVDTVDSVDKYSYTGTAYDMTGRKKTEILCKDKVDLNQIPVKNLITTSYDYYKSGKIKSIYDSSGRRKDFTYDDDGILTKEDDYTDETRANTIEYVNNHLGKPEQKKVHVRRGDIFGNDFENNEDLILCTNYTYDKNGNLKSETRPDGVVTSYEYDNMNRQTKISQPRQDEYENLVEVTKITAYNWDGKPVSVIDANGNITKYIYNQRDLLEKVIDAKDGVTAYFYDNAGRKIAEVSPGNYNTAKTLSQMTRTEYGYDLMDRIKSKTNLTEDGSLSENTSYSYDNNGNLIKSTDPLGYDTTYTYNFENKLTSTLDPVSAERGLDFTFKYEYDALGRKIFDINAAGVVTLYYYDDVGNLVKTAVKKVKNAPEVITQLNTYDLLGNVLTKIDANGNTITFEYNAFGKVRRTINPSDSSIPAETITYQYDVLGNLKSQKDSSGTIDLFTYDNQGREISHTQQAQDGSDAATTSVKYDKNGNKRFETDGNGNTKENTFDELNRIKTTTVTVSGKNQTTAFTYDVNGNQLTSTDWRGNTYTNIYDDLNRIVEKRDPDNKIIQRLEYNADNVQAKSYDALGNMTEYTYDKDNRLLSTIDPEIHVTSQTYDNVGNIKTKTDGNGNITTFNYDEFDRLISVVNANNETVSYTYDLNGNMLTQTDAKGNIVTYEYNVRNKQVKRGDGSSVYESYVYFADGNLKSKIDRNGNTANYLYDSHGRLLSEKVGSISISYTFDKNGNRLTMTDFTGITTQTFDELNRVKTKNTPDIGKTSYVYNIISDIQNGNIAQSSTDPKGNAIEKVFDREDRLEEVIADGQLTVYEYYDNGSKKSVTYSDGSKEEYTYYKDGLLKTLINKKSNGSIFDSYSYTYDAAHNQISKIDSKRETKYSYDSLNRLESVTEPSRKVTTYTFDAAGNRAAETITENDSTTAISYAYNNQNKLLKIQTKVNDIITEEKSYTYDNNGNQISESNGSKNTINTYDELNQLVKSVINDVTIINGYNGDGLRVAKTAESKTVEYLYEDINIILELDGEGNQKARNVQGTNLISRTADGQTAYYFYNGHGDVTTLIDSDGQTLASYYYDAFGNLSETSGTIDNPYKFAGYQYDSETGDYYLMSRMYDPETARFLQEDSYRGDKSNPLSLNLYTYCHNEPVMYIDPTGHWAEDGSDKKYKRYSSVYNNIANLTWQYDHAGSNAGKEQIAAKTRTLRGIADVQIKLKQLHYAGDDGKLLDVDGVMGKNTAAAINYFTLKNKINIFGKNGRDIDGATYNAVMGVEVRDVANVTTNNSSSYELKSSGNFKQKFGDIIEKQAQELNIDPNVLGGILYVESGGRGFSNGRMVIRFEAARFNALTYKKYSKYFTYNKPRVWEGQKYRISEDDNWVTMHTSQESEYEVLEFTKELNEEEAYKSLGMGMGQVQGENYKTFGFKSAKEMYYNFSQSEENQIIGAIGYIKADGLVKACQDKNYTAIARGYNGSGQVNKYSTMLKNGVEVYSKLED